MHYQLDWMKPSDRSIVRELAKYGGWMKPATLALNLPYTRNHTGTRCRVLTDYGLVERHDENAGYRVTDLGREFLADNLEPGDLEDDPDDDADEGDA